MQYTLEQVTKEEHTVDVYAKVFTDKNPSGKHLLLHLSDNPFDPENVNKIRTAVESVGIDGTQ